MVWGVSVCEHKGGVQLMERKGLVQLQRLARMGKVSSYMKLRAEARTFAVRL